uniref:TlyA family RNA methyltransferase n=1 Tax=Caldisericum exile TaxID=693075 RepID=A0A7C4TW63_9BACT
MKRRLDEEIVRRNLLNSRNEAKVFILEGKVSVNGVKAIKPSELVSEEDSIEILSSKEYVSRGGYKLASALSTFNIDVREKVCVDIGASTGGFTHCLLKNGARRVYAIDVGSGLLDPIIRENPKVTLIENFNARFLSPNVINEHVGIVTIDVSFISILKIIPGVKEIICEDADIISLIKPQFEGEPRYLKKGIVKNEDFHKIILKRVRDGIKDMGLVVINATYSPIRGGKGNIEFFFHIKKKGEFANDELLDKIVEEAWEHTK